MDDNKYKKMYTAFKNGHFTSVMHRKWETTGHLIASAKRQCLKKKRKKLQFGNIHNICECPPVI